MLSPSGMPGKKKDCIPKAFSRRNSLDPKSHRRAFFTVGNVVKRKHTKPQSSRRNTLGSKMPSVKG